MRRLPQRCVDEGRQRIPGSRSRASPGTRSPAGWTRSARTSPRGRPATASASAGTGATASSATRAARVTSSTARRPRSPASASTAATPSTRSSRRRRRHASRRSSTPPRPGPLLCAGVTTYNALRNSGARPGDTVAVQGIGGLGPPRASSTRRGWAFAPSRSRAARTRRRSRGSSALTSTSTRRRWTRPRGCRRLGGADLVLATAPNSAAIASTVDGLKPRGKLLIVAAPFEPIADLGARAALRQDHRRLAERQRDRLRGDDGVQRAHGRAPADREVSAR